MLAWDGDGGVAIAQVADWMRLDETTARPLTTCASPSQMVLDSEHLALLCTDEVDAAIEFVPLAAALNGGATQSARIATTLSSQSSAALLFPTVGLASGRALFVLHDVLSVGVDGKLTHLFAEPRTAWEVDALPVGESRIAATLSRINQGDVTVAVAVGRSVRLYGARTDFWVR
jgi:hypothetical protein